MNRADDEHRAFIDSIPSLAWSASPDGSMLSFNRRWLDYTGLTAEETMGWGWKVAVHPDDLPKLLEVFRNALDTGRPFDVAGRLRARQDDFAPLVGITQGQLSKIEGGKLAPGLDLLLRLRERADGASIGF